MEGKENDLSRFAFFLFFSFRSALPLHCLHYSPPAAAAAASIDWLSVLR